MNGKQKDSFSCVKHVLDYSILVRKKLLKNYYSSVLCQCNCHVPKSLIAKWLEQSSRCHEVYCHDLEVMSLKPG